MTFVIAEPCVGKKRLDCVDVCPVDCIHPKSDEPGSAEADQLYIHPDECIDCGACKTACPEEAIFPLEKVPPQWQSYIAKNAAYFAP